MKLSELREMLAAIQEREGDIDVKIPAMVTPDQDEDQTVEISGIATVIEDDGSVSYSLLCDAETLDEMAG